MRNPLEPFLDSPGFVCLDGGLATELERRGADLDDPLWSAKLLLEDPGAIEELHYDYFLAGADVGTSASYQASFSGFAERGLDASDTEALLRRSVELVHRARARFWDEPANRAGRRPPLVAASVGCYGAVLHDGSEYRGDYGLGSEELGDFHRERLTALVEAGPDILAFETLPCRLEAEVLVVLLREGGGNVPAWMSFSCRNEREVCHGELFSHCLRLVLAESSVVAVGVNCTAPRLVAPLLASAAGCGDKPLVAYPNSGERWDAAGHRWESSGEPASDLVELAPVWVEKGARIIGGCCRTTPETIRAVARALRGYSGGCTTAPGDRLSSQSSCPRRRCGRSRRCRPRRCGSPCARPSR